MRRGGALLACAAAALLLLGGCSSREQRIEAGVKKATEFARSAAWDKAHVEVRNVLQIDPKNAQAYFIAGQVAEAKGEAQRAFGSYGKAVELSPEHLDARAALARFYLLANQPDKARAALQAVLAADPQHVGARTLRAALAATGGDGDDAMAQARALLRESGGANADASLLLAGLHAARAEPAAALATLELALKAHPKRQDLVLAAGQIAAAASEPAQQALAAGYFRRAAEQAPASFGVWTQWVAFHQRRQELDLAEQVLRSAIQAQPEDGRRTLALLGFLAEHRGSLAAEQAFLAEIRQKPREVALRFGLAELYRGAERRADARQVWQQIVEQFKDAPSLQARNLLAGDHWSRGQVDAARRLVAEVLAANAHDQQALVLRGRILLAEGDSRAAVLDLRAAARDQPGQPELVGLLAQAHRRAGEPQLAREVIAEALKARPDNVELRLLHVADLADARDFKAAGAELDKVLAAAPRQARAWDMKVRLALAQKDPAAAEKLLVAYKKRYPDDPTGFIRLGQYHADQKRFDAAIKEYDAASRLDQPSATASVAAIGLLVSQQRHDEAQARIDALLARDPKLALGHRLQAELAQARGAQAAAEQAWRRFVALVPHLAVGHVNLARSVRSQHGLAKALAVLEEGEKLAPNELELPALRAEWLAADGRRAEAIAAFEKLLARAPDEDAIANNLAYLLLEHGTERAQFERALALTERFAASSNPSYLDTRGWALHRLGRTTEAVVLLEKASARAPKAPLLQLHLGLALHRQGESERARQYLSQALASKAPLPNLEEARALVAQR